MSFDQMVLHGGAPALCGIKPASLFSMTRQAFEAGRWKIGGWNRELRESGRRIAVLRRTEGLLLFFVYDGALLRRTLCGGAQAAYLARKGYPVGRGMDAVLAELFRRLARAEGAFPHEIGLFLGYPLDDVIAYERNAGRGSKFTGCWQAYGDVAAASERTRLYRECSACCCRLLAEGLGVAEVCRRYRMGMSSTDYKTA